MGPRGVFQPGPKFLALLSSVNARRYFVRTEIRGGIFQFLCKALFGRGQNSWRYFPVYVRGVCRLEPQSLAIFTNLNARRYSVRTEVPGNTYQFKCEAFFGQNRNSWRYFPIWTRGAFRSEPKSLSVFTNLNARRFSVRTEITRDAFQL